MADLGPLEADFATLDADLRKIADAKHTLGQAGVAALDGIVRESGAAAVSGDGALAAAFQDVLYKILRDSAVADLDGNMNFAVDGASVMMHAGPVMQEVVQVVQGKVQSFLNELTVHTAVAAQAATSAATSAVEAATTSASAPETKPDDDDRPTVKLKVDLASLFAGLIQTVAVQAAQASKKNS